MDKCLKDKAHFIIAQTIWNNKNGKAVFAEQVFDRCQKKFQDEINRELYKLIEQGGGGGTGKDGKTPVLKAGDVTSLPYGSKPTFKLVYEGDNTEGNPVYRMDLGIPQGKSGEDGNDGDDGIDGKTPIFETGTITTLAPDQPATCIITKTGDNLQGNPIYRVDVGIPKGDTGAPGDTPSLDGYATETWVTTQINNAIGTINSALDEINGEVV